MNEKDNVSKKNYQKEFNEIKSISEVKITLIPTLFALLLLGAKDTPVQISTIEFAKKMEKSQQLISKHLLELEAEGYIERLKIGRNYAIKLTEKGFLQLATIYSILKSSFESLPLTIDIEGVLFSGFGEGAYYVSLKNYKNQFITKLGFEPYPGTLNLRLNSQKDRKIRNELKFHTGITIDGFKNQHRSYGNAKCFKVIVNNSIKGALGIFERTHYDDFVIEIISPIKIRDKLCLKDGDKVKIKLFLR